MQGNFAIMSVLIGGAAIASGIGILVKMFKVADTKNWLTTQGTILTSKITQEFTRDRHHGTGQGTYVPHVEYEYRLRGRTYHGNTVHPTGLQSCSIHSVCQRIINKYPVGQTVNVYYDPDNPENACLDRTVKSYNIALMIICAAICFLAGILLPLYGTGILTL